MEMYTRGWGRRRGGNGGVAGDVHAKVGVGWVGGGKVGLVDMYMLGIYTDTGICSIRHIYRQRDMFHQAYIPTERYVPSGIYTDREICSIRHIYRQRDMFHQAYIPTERYVPSGIYTDREICSIRHIYRQRDMFHQAYIPTERYVPSGIYTDREICSIRHIYRHRAKCTWHHKTVLVQ